MLVIRTPLNVMNFNKKNEYDENWLKARIDIMKKYVLPSMINQTDQEFYWVIESRKETKQFVKSYFDPPQKNILVLDCNELNDLNEKICHYHKTLTLIRLNSDDCYAVNFIEETKKIRLKPDRLTIVWQNGYMWYMKEDVIVERHFNSPPFYALVYKSDEFLSGRRYKIPSHTKVASYKSHIISDKQWLWLVHGLNNKILRGDKYPPYTDFKQVKDKEKVLSCFALTTN